MSPDDKLNPKDSKRNNEESYLNLSDTPERPQSKPMIHADDLCLFGCAFVLIAFVVLSLVLGKWHWVLLEKDQPYYEYGQHIVYDSAAKQNLFVVEGKCKSDVTRIADNSKQIEVSCKSSHWRSDVVYKRIMSNADSVNVMSEFAHTSGKNEPFRILEDAQRDSHEQSAKMTGEAIQ